MFPSPLMLMTMVWEMVDLVKKWKSPFKEILQTIKAIQRLGYQIHL